MIDIYTIKGERYSYDDTTMRLFKDGTLLSQVVAEPVFQNNSSGIPEFAGIYLKDSNKIISLSGNINQIVDPNSIIV